MPREQPTVRGIRLRRRLVRRVEAYYSFAILILLVALTLLLLYRGWQFQNQQRIGAKTPETLLNYGLESLSDGHLHGNRIYGIALAVAFLLTLRRVRLSYLASRSGAVEVRPLTGSQDLGDRLDELTAAFRDYLTLPKVYETTSVPGDPEPDRLFSVLQPGSRGGVYAVVASALAYIFPTRAFVVAASLRTGDGERSKGVTIRVKRIPGPYVDLETQWSRTWEAALQRAAYAVAANILPQTSTGNRAPWTAWRHKELPIELVRSYQRAKTMLSERRYDEALALYRSALRHDPKNIDIRYEIGQVYERLQQYPHALDAYLSLTDELFPSRPQTKTTQRKFERRGVLRYSLFATRNRDPLAIRFRYITTLGFGGRLADEIIDEIADYSTKGKGWIRDRRPWRSNEVRDIHQRLLKLFPSRYGDLSDGNISLSLSELLRAFDSSLSDKELVRQKRKRKSSLALYFLCVGTKEHELLMRAARPYRLLRLLGLWPETQLTMRLLRIQSLSLEVRKERIRAHIASHEANPGTPVLPWSRSPKWFDDELRQAGYRDGSPYWQEHYLAACIYAHRLLESSLAEAQRAARSQKEEEEQTLALRAVQALDRAQKCDNDGQFLAAKNYWLFAGDPDLRGLRRREQFRALEARIHGAPGPEVEEIFDYEMEEYLRTLVIECTANLNHQWLDRLARNRNEVLPADIERWWREEQRAVVLAIRLGKYHRQPSTRQMVIRSLAKWAEEHDLPRPRLVFPDFTASRRVFVGSQIKARSDNLHEILTFLGNRFASDETYVDGALEKNTTVWRSFCAKQVQTYGYAESITDEDYREMCARRAGLWAVFRQWAEPLPSVTRLDVQSVIASLPEPPNLVIDLTRERPRARLVARRRSGPGSS